MAAQSDALEKIRRYEIDIQKTDAAVEESTSGAAQATHEARLTKTITDLQNRVQEQQAALEKLRGSPTHPAPTQPSLDPAVRLHQVQVVKTAYESLTTVEPTLPPGGSSLPALLAVRNTQSLIAETKTSITAVQQKLAKARTQLEQEEADLRDARLITSALEKRIVKLRTLKEDRTQRTPSQATKELLQKQEQRRKTYENGTRRLIRAFNDFTDEHLSAMLAAEELGGPVVGDMVDVDESILGAGFNQQGKAKKFRTGTSIDEKKRQRRIDEIWGRKDGGDADLDNARSEKEAAGAEMRTLTEDLLNAVADERTASAYIELRRDSAAARFLVRAKVAQFHPRDARRLRLIDFARELAE
ncbi:MAG: hypothetical protein M1830_003914 [Pleopsidium flavum]|nr:MAG: hypothetical protein M1830_003914 [Pleopsidium flavum]